MKTISVKVEEELLKQINDAARLRGLEQKDFIVKTLEKEALRHQKYLNKLNKVEKQIRKEIVAELDSDNENGQGSV
ncbi:MAG: hypothetical protein WA254_06185 [Candidatus Sulfotelmatobacter sp.]